MNPKANPAGPGLVDRLEVLLRRLLRRPPSDWAGPDASRSEPLGDVRFEPASPFEVVWLPAGGNRGAAAAERADGLARAGHRTYRVVPELAASGPPYSIRERGRNQFDVALRGAEVGPAFASLEALSRDAGFGAAAMVVEDARWDALAERLSRERGWARLDAALESPATDARALEESLAGAFPLVSVVVVTFENRELNRLCLESLLGRTEWPNLEAIFVDNGSTDGTRGLLEEAARRDGRVSLLALDRNRGFPAACNAGLARARGRYLVVLNNDTVVTRGWLSALVGHLSENPALGLVGPVTNAIANEARVETGYRRLADLSRWAADWTREHDGETFEIATLAFFCAAMRREVFESVGPLDERFGIGMFEDGDYCRRVRAAGLEIRCARDAFVHHWQMASFRRMSREAYLALYEENRRLFEEKWGQVSV